MNCEECKGRGLIDVHDENGELGEVECPDCNGTGKERCGWCGGDGLHLTPEEQSRLPEEDKPGPTCGLCDGSGFEPEEEKNDD